MHTRMKLGTSQGLIVLALAVSACSDDPHASKGDSGAQSDAAVYDQDSGVTSAAHDGGGTTTTQSNGTNGTLHLTGVSEPTDAAAPETPDADVDGGASVDAASTSSSSANSTNGSQAVDSSAASEESDTTSAAGTSGATSVESSSSASTSDGTSETSANSTDLSSDSTELSSDSTDTSEPPVIGPTETGVGDTVRGRTGALLLQVTTAENVAVPNGRVLYDITVGNVSNSSIDGVSVLLRTPAGHGFSALTDAEPNATGCAGSSYCDATEEATWALGEIPAGETRTITVNQLVLSTLEDGDTIATPVRVTATGVNPLTLTKTVPVVTAPLATVSLSANSNPVVPGQLVEFTVDIGQIGDTALSDGQLSLQLPSQFTYQSATGGAALSDEGEGGEGGVLTWDVEGMPVETSHRYRVTALMSSEATFGNILNPIATFTHAGGLDVDNEAQVPLSVVESHPLTFNVTQMLNPARPGQQILYNVTVGNTSEVAIPGVNVLWRVPTGLGFSALTDAEPNAAGCAGSSYCDATEESSWAIGEIPAGETRSIAVNPTVGAGLLNGVLLPSRFDLRATALPQREIWTTTPVDPAPKVQLALTSRTGPVAEARQVELLCDVGQVGATTAEDAVLTIELPQEVEVLDDGAGTVNGQTVSWTLGDLPVATALTRSLRVEVDASVVAGTILEARARVEHGGGLDEDASATWPFQIVAEPMPLTLSIAQDQAPAIPGGVITYLATVTNQTEVAMNGISVLYRTADPLGFSALVYAEPNLSGCAGSNYCDDTEEGVWSVGTLAAGASASLTLQPVVDVAAVDGSLVVAPFSASATGMNPTFIALAMPVQAAPEAELVLTTNSSVVAVDQVFTYSIDVGQVGADPLENTRVRAFLPEGLEIESVSDGGTIEEDGSVTWDLGTVAVGGTSLRTIDATLASSFAVPDSVVARAELSFDGGREVDAKAEVSITALQDALPLDVEVDLDTTSVVPGERVLVTTSITNTTARSIEGVTLLLRTPREMAFSGVTDADPDAAGCAGSSYCDGGEEGSWSLGVLAAGEQRLVTINLQALETLIGGELIAVRQRLVATGLDATLNLENTVTVVE